MLGARFKVGVALAQRAPSDYKGRFVETLGAGRHVRWGRHFTLDAQDLRKASLLVAGQEVLTADLKRAFADVLKAKQEGQAALERARGESASLRNLANAARVLEGNPALMNLRLIQSLSAAQNAGTTLVLGVPGFVPLKNGKAGSPATNTDESGAG